MSDDKGLVDTVPTEVYLAYERQAKDIASMYAPNAIPAAKTAILVAMLKARKSGAEDSASNEDALSASVLKSMLDNMDDTK